MEPEEPPPEQRSTAPQIGSEFSAFRRNVRSVSTADPSLTSTQRKKRKSKKRLPLAVAPFDMMYMQQPIYPGWTDPYWMAAYQQAYQQPMYSEMHSLMAGRQSVQTENSLIPVNNAGRSSMSAWSESFLRSPDNSELCPNFDSRMGAAQDIKPANVSMLSIASCRVSFNTNNILTFVKCKERCIELYHLDELDVTKDRIDQNLLSMLRRHIGPLYRPHTSMQSVCNFCLAKINEGGPHVELWQIVHMLLVKQKSDMNNFDIWVLLDSIDYEKCSQPTSSQHRIYDHERIVESLASSESVISAMQFAADDGNWNHALFLAAQCPDAEERNVILQRFVDSLDPSSPLTTYYQIVMGRIPDVVQRGDLLTGGRWKRHFAMLMSLRSTAYQLVHRTVTLLCRTLIAYNEINAFHICRLLFLRTFDPFAPGPGRMTLLGRQFNTAEKRCIEDLLQDPEVLDSFELTEIYEYSQDCVLPTLLPFKIAFAKLLFTNKLYERSWKYCEHVGKILTQHWDSKIVFDVDRQSLDKLVDVTFRLKVHLPNIGKSSSWLSELSQLGKLASLYCLNPSLSYDGYSCSSLLNTKKETLPCEKAIKEEFNTEIQQEQVETTTIIHSEELTISGQVQETLGISTDVISSTNLMNSTDPVSSTEEDLQSQQFYTPFMISILKENDEINDRLASISLDDSTNEQQSVEKAEHKERKSEPLVQKPTLLNRVLGIFNSKPINPVHLPDDSKSNFIYDAEKQKWIDTNATDEQEDNVPTGPPPVGPSPTSVTSKTSYRVAGSRFGYVNAWEQSSERNSKDIPTDVPTTADSLPSKFFTPI